MGNCLTFLLCGITVEKSDVLPIDTIFKLPSPLPSWPQGGEFANGTINLGGLDVCQISTFSRIWSTQEGGPDDLGATFFEPSQIPTGFFMLGCYSQPNNKPFSGWVLAGKDVSGDSSKGAVLKAPVDYSLVWSSKSMKIKQDGIGYIWFPTPPEGYRAVGHIVTSSPEKPPVDKIRCVRADLTEESEQDTWIWGDDKASSTSSVNVYSSRPVTRGTQALGVCVGTFIAQIDGVASPSPLVCLKNSASSLLSMPNLTQIHALIQAYSPLIYHHPDELYLPSSVNWFFNNGALLYKKGDESNPVSIDPNGSNLPQGGANDGAYWLDLPINEAAKEKVMKGELQSSEAYLHIKPMFGGTFTDIAIWVFYPYNGPAKAKLEFVDIPLGKIGEHIGDWEHITLRISNFNGELWGVYFSQHSGGTWVDSSELEFEVGNKVVGYASLHGHALYSKPGLVLQGAAGIGIRNDTAKSEKIMDTGVRYVVLSGEYLGFIEEPPWLNYERKWGPKVTYEIGEEINKVDELLQGGFKTAFEWIVNILPDELLMEDGPTGPKMKSSWNGDEV